MAIIDTVRPNVVVASGGWGGVGSGGLAGVTSDNSDASYAVGNTLDFDMRLECDPHTPPADHQRHRARPRIRARVDPDTPGPVTAARVVWGFRRRNAGGSDIVTAKIFSNLTPQTIAGPYSQNSYLGLGVNAPLLFVTVAQNDIAFTPAADLGADIWVQEMYVDIDCRRRPTLTGDVRDASGVSQAGGTITDTNRPSIVFADLSYDGLPARSWKVTIRNSGGTVVATYSGTGRPPTTVVVNPLPNDTDYEADLQIVSTIRVNTAYSSSIVTVPFSLDFVPPDVPLVSVGQCEVPT